MYSRYFISFNDNALYISYREREIRSRNHQHIQQKPIFIIIYTYIYISVNFPVWLEPGWFSVRSPHCLQERKKSTGNIPKPGDPGYISSTAIRQKSRNNLCGSKVTLHVYHCISCIPTCIGWAAAKMRVQQSWYKRKHSASYGIHFESLRHLFQIISIRCQEELGLGTKKTIIQQKHLTNFDKTRPGETATQPNPFSKTYSRVATWSQQCLNIKLRKEQ